MNSLKELGIKEESIKNILNAYNNDIKKEIEANIDNIVDNIKFFKSIGISNINDLLEADITVFFQKVENTKRVVKNIGIEKTVNMLLIEPENIEFFVE